MIFLLHLMYCKLYCNINGDPWLTNRGVSDSLHRLYSNKQNGKAQKELARGAVRQGDIEI